MMPRLNADVLGVIGSFVPVRERHGMFVVWARDMNKQLQQQTLQAQFWSLYAWFSAHFRQTRPEWSDWGYTMSEYVLHMRCALDMHYREDAGSVKNIDNAVLAVELMAPDSYPPFFGAPDFQMDQTATRKMAFGHFRFNQKSVVHHPQAPSPRRTIPMWPEYVLEPPPVYRPSSPPPKKPKRGLMSFDRKWRAIALG